MQNIAVLSLFRDSVKWHGEYINQVDRYFRQLTQQSYPFYRLKVVGLEGNSMDSTYEQLLSYRSLYKNVEILKHDNLAESSVASVEDDSRIVALSTIANELLQHSCSYSDLDYIIWLESDLIIDTDIIQRLYNVAEKNTIVAPMIYLEGRGIFYDTWGFRELNGERWTTKQRQESCGLKEMLSIGSCAIIDANLIRNGLNFGEGAFVELCSRGREMGAKVYVDTDTQIYHPGSRHVKNRWI